ncbi:MAG: PqqD family peptide modification chaperone [Candidatus Omnitrophota bacterium]|nr:PqqD family peptide modification chaperone [Candidatus Omnitrophota bacterium]
MRRKNDVLSANFSEGTVVFYLKTRRSYVFNTLAQEVWSKLSRPRTIADIVNLLAKRYAVGTRRLRQDLNFLLEKLKKKGLVEYVKT